jgi:hypothetical protein
MKTPLSGRRGRTAIRLLVVCLGALVLVYGAAVTVLAVAMRQPPERFGRIMSHVPWVVMPAFPFEHLWMRARAGHLDPGDPAPDFALPTSDRQRTIRLSDFRGVRPVALVFGSYT